MFDKYIIDPASVRNTGPADAPAPRRRNGAIVATVIVLLMVAVAWWFYPVWTGEVIPYDAWRFRMWFASWV